MTGPSRGADRTEIHEIEVSGTVRETGPGVTELAVGQQVAAFTAGGGLAAVARTRAEFVAPVPGQLSLAVAAAAPLMLTTGLLLLGDAARFRPGESVLVHSASGGVGSAITQLVPAPGGGLACTESSTCSPEAGWTSRSPRSARSPKCPRSTSCSPRAAAKASTSLGWSADPASRGRTPRPRGRGQRDHRGEDGHLHDAGRVKQHGHRRNQQPAPRPPAGIRSTFSGPPRCQVRAERSAPVSWA
jgi:hypothetical protein